MLAWACSLSLLGVEAFCSEFQDRHRKALHAHGSESPNLNKNCLASVALSGYSPSTSVCGIGLVASQRPYKSPQQGNHIRNSSPHSHALPASIGRHETPDVQIPEQHHRSRSWRTQASHLPHTRLSDDEGRGRYDQGL